MPHDRRSFLKRSGAAFSAAALAGCAPESGEADAAERFARLDPDTLRTVGAIVLPSELGDGGREAAVVAFERWAEGYDAVPELNHGYGTSEIRYGPADPVPAWSAQLEALHVEARRRHGVRFDELDGADRAALLGRHVAQADGTGLPEPLAARHVAVALMAHWAGSPEATDLCYGARVSPRTCRGLDASSADPETHP